MRVTSEVLRRRYESMEDDELVDLYLKSALKVTEKRKIQVGLLFPITIATFNVSSELTDMAKPVLKEVLATRGITEDRLNAYIAKDLAGRKTNGEKYGKI